MKIYVVIIATAMTMMTGANRALTEELQFAEKNFFDSGVTVGISGTMRGDGVPYKKNTYAIFCSKDRGECIVASIEALNEHLIGRMDYPYTVPITRWDAYEVVAQNEPSDWTCLRTTITILRNSHNALWIEENINSGKGTCGKTSWIRKWSIE